MADPVHGARNPKEARVQIRLAGTIDERMLRLADTLGMNKGTTASMCAAFGLRMLEQVVFANEIVGPKVGALMQEHGVNEVNQDLDNLGIPHK